MRRELKNLNVFLVCHLPSMLVVKDIVGHPALTSREHLFPVAIVLQRPWLANQRINHVAIIDRRTMFANQMRHGLNRMN